MVEDGTIFAKNAKNVSSQVDDLDGFFPNLRAENHKFHRLLVVEIVVTATFFVEILVCAVNSWQETV